MKTLFQKLVGMLCALFVVSASWAAEDYTQYVDPHIGSGGHGHVFVGANVPLGAVQLGPQNLYQGWDWCSGYHYSDLFVIGFSHTHLSGTGCADLGDVIFMPYQGRIRTRAKGGEYASSTYKHENEVVQPGYYAVKLDNGVNVELTATERVGMHHYTYTKNDEARLLIDLDNANSNKAFESYIHKISDRVVEGYRYCNGWSPTRKVYFRAEFSEPIANLKVFKSDKPMGVDELLTTRVKSVVTFSKGTKDVTIKVALSSVSIENARLNMEKELPGWNFAQVKAAAHDKWQKRLSTIEIDATPKQKTIFYTALYHAFIDPNLYCDVNGQYRGIDDKIYTVKAGNNYTILSLWDTYRQLHPMYTIIAPELVNDLMNSMLTVFDQNGKLPIWTLQSGETECMPGYSSVPVIADAYLKGFKGFDAQKALHAMVVTATNKNQNGITAFMKYGYIPADTHGEATSICLEYAADDWGLALMAKQMGKMDIYNTFIKRGHAYEQYWDNSIKKCRPKMMDGSWYAPYDPFLANHRDRIGDFTEGNGWQYTFMVPQNPDGLIALHGGDEAFIQNMDSLFVAEGDLGEGAPADVSGLIGQYAHGNEPNHHVPYLYAYAGAQYKTAEKIRYIQETQYTDQPDGYCGNEDCGQMSAWHIMSALGFYQVNPSNGIYVMGSPLFKKATIHLPEGKTFVVESPNNTPKTVYIKSAKLNGKKYNKAFLTYADIMNGGVLSLQMSETPNKQFGASKQTRPTSAQ